jgi:hypothetical protein
MTLIYLHTSNESYDGVKHLIESFLTDVKNDTLALHLEYTSWEEIDIRKIVSELLNTPLDEFYLEQSESLLGSRSCISYMYTINEKDKSYLYTSVPYDGNYHERLVFLDKCEED